MMTPGVFRVWYAYAYGDTNQTDPDVSIYYAVLTVQRNQLTLPAGMVDTSVKSPEPTLVGTSSLPQVSWPPAANALTISVDATVAGSTPSGTPTISKGNSKQTSSGSPPTPTGASTSPSIPPVGQLSDDNYSNTNSQAYADREYTCLATVYAMIARDADPQAPNGTYDIDTFWVKQSDGKYEADTGDPISGEVFHAEQRAVWFAYHAPLDRSHGLCRDPVIIKGTIDTSNTSTGSEAHWMLAVGTDTSSSGQPLIVANDPWTGTQVEVDTAGTIERVLNPSTGSFVDVEDPTTGRMYSVGSPQISALAAALGYAPDGKTPLYAALTSFVLKSQQQVTITSTK